MNACVNYQEKPSKNFTVTFDPNNSQNHCMYHIGSQATTDVTVSGLSCASIGYVEAKVSTSGGDYCSTDESIWNIGYSTQGLPDNKSGNIKTRWRKR